MAGADSFECSKKFLALSVGISWQLECVKSNIS